MRVETMIALLKKDNDSMVKERIMRDLGRVMGEENSSRIIEAFNAESDSDFHDKIDMITSSGHSDLVAELIDAMEKERHTERKQLPIDYVMELYYSGEEFLVKKAEEYVRADYEYLVRRIIEKTYPAYDKKYAEDLFKSGANGLIKAMKDYKKSSGAFSSYSRFYIIHEIADLVADYHLRENSPTSFVNKEADITMQPFEEGNRLPIDSVMEIYHSGDDFLVKKAEEYVRANYGEFVHQIIDSYYPVYEKEFGEELFNSGINGLIEAMKDYKHSSGEFSCASRLYNIHKIVELGADYE